LLQDYYLSLFQKNKIMKNLILILCLVVFSSISYADNPVLIMPKTIEVYANGLNSIAFVPRVMGISEESQERFSFTMKGLPEVNSPTFNKKNYLFYWQPILINVGSYDFKVSAKGSSGRSLSDTVKVNVLKAPSLEALPKGWMDKKKEQRYFEGKKLFPSTNFIEIDIAAQSNYEITIIVENSIGEACRLIYLPEDGNDDTNNSQKTAVIKIGSSYRGGDVEKIKRDLYEDLYDKLGLTFKKIKLIEIHGKYLLKDLKIYDKASLVSATGIENIQMPEINISFDDRFYLDALYSKKDPITIAEVPVIKVDFNTRSGLRWRKSSFKIDKQEKSAAKGEFTLIVVKPYKKVSTFDVDYAMFMINIPNGQELPFGEHTFLFEGENAYGIPFSKEVYARVISVPAEVVGKPMVYPNPFSPSRQGEAKIQYTLSMQTNIELVIFGVDGTIITKKSYIMGNDGARKGKNTIFWTGRTDAGFSVSNGIYSAVIIDKNENRILDKFLITIYQ
jgi:hypothetical protein